MAGDYTSDYATNVISSVYPNAKITSGLRSAEDPLSKANPNSYHGKGLAGDVAPIPGMTFDDYVQGFKDKGARILEARNEVTDPVPWSTGPHWHVAIAPGFKLPNPQEQTEGQPADPNQEVYTPAPEAQNNIQTPQGPINRGIWEKISDEYHRTANSAFPGWAAQELMQHLPYPMHVLTGVPDLSSLSSAQRDAVLTQARKNIEQHYAQLDMKDPASIGEQLAGGLGGADPSWLFGGIASKGMSPLAAAASRIASVGIVGALDNATVQGLNMAKGLQGKFNSWEALGAGLGAGAMRGLGEVGSRVAPFFKHMMGDESTGRPAIHYDTPAEAAADLAQPGLSGEVTDTSPATGDTNAQVPSGTAGVGAVPNEGSPQVVAEGEGGTQGTPQIEANPQSTNPQEQNPEAATTPEETPSEPVRPAVDEKYAGSINKDRLIADDEHKNALDEITKNDLVFRGVQTNRETANRAYELLTQNSEKDLLDKTAVDFDDLPAYSLAVRSLSKTMRDRTLNLASNIYDAAKAGLEIPDSAREASRQAYELAVQATDKAGKVATSAGRTLQAHSIPAGDVNMLSPENVDKLFEQHGGDADAISKSLGLSKKANANDLFQKGLYNSFLSNPITHLKYWGSVYLNGLMDLGVDTGASVLGQLGRFSAQDASRVYGTEIASRAFGLGDGFLSALKSRIAPQGWSSLADKDTMSRLLSEETGGGFNPSKAVNNVLPTSILHNVEDFNRDVFGQSYLWGEAAKSARQQVDAGSLSWKDLPKTIRDMVANPTDEMLDAASQRTEKTLFNDPMGPLGQMTQDARNGFMKKVLPGISNLAMMDAPFVRRIDGVLRAGNRFTGGPFGLLDRYTQQGLKEGKGANFDRAISQLTASSAMMAMFAQMAHDGLVTGTGPSDYKKYQELYATGWRPNSVKVGDNYYSLKGITPIEQASTAAADLVDELKQTGDGSAYSDKMFKAIFSIGHSVLSNSTVKSFIPIVAPLDNQHGESILRNYIENIPGQFVPAGLRELNTQEFDPMQRDTRGATITETAENRVKAAVPYLSQSLPPKLDVWGHPLEKDQGIFKSSQEDQDPVIQETQQLSNGMKGSIITPPDKSLKLPNGVEIMLSHDQQRQATQSHGLMMRNFLGNLYSTPGWQHLSDDTKREIIQKEVLGPQGAHAMADKISKIRALKGGQ